MIDHERIERDGLSHLITRCMRSTIVSNAYVLSQYHDFTPLTRLGSTAISCVDWSHWQGYESTLDWGTSMILRRERVVCCTKWRAFMVLSL